MLDALCREHREVTFFPALSETTVAAKAECARCLVQRECRTTPTKVTSEAFGPV
jgi:hypothetical protein